MAMPNPFDNDNPDDYDDDREEHGEDIGSPLDRGGKLDSRQADILHSLAVDLEGSDAEHLAHALSAPVVPDGGNLGRAVAPHLERVTKTGDWLRMWGPATAGTVAAGVAVVVLPLPGPLALYVLAVAAYGWWHCAGRPGATETVRLLAAAIGDAAAWVRRHVEHLAQRRARYESRRTTSEKKEQN
ncbi:hypothetical protein [Nocardia bovistercoris]|uniref:Uncharacterized protein n=1 Tax=Nocardia bovistercoris TaxID=2785916 RepID=A0A931N3K5_9NOCA|nr:hypothetical protein [Nocardia bovistercoris]MBH0777276.1 hypothetical protein [Nocardia bovistercoris]